MSDPNSPATKVHFISLGCPKNRIDTETMLADLPGERFEVVGQAEDADVVVVNTCAFVDSAKQESVDTILEVAELKAQGLKKLVVTGCLSQRYPEALARELPEVDHFLGTNDLGAIGAVVGDQTDKRIIVGSPDRLNFNWEAPRYNTTGVTHTAYVKVAEGCSNTCAFCIIPTLRGPQRSRSVDSVVREVTMLAAQGVVELNLVAQDLTAYGYDLKPRTNLTELLEALVPIRGIRWIRLLYAYPRSFPKGLVKLMARAPKIVPYLDMPLQHISDPVLKGMRRATNSATIRKRIRELRDQVPNLTLRTTLIAGFPGETEADHEALKAFLREVKFERMGAFAFSQEEGTPANELPHQLDEATKERRLEELMFTQRAISRAHNEALVGAEVEVLIERLSEDSELVWVGRTQGQAPDIDGVTYVGNVDGLAPGVIIRGVITQVTDYDLVVDAVV